MWLPVSLVRQRRQADCLVACAKMAFDYLLIPGSYEWIRATLGTTESGTPFSRLQRLQPHIVTVIHDEGNLATLQGYLDLGLPIIVDVRTWTLSHWRQRTDIEEAERDTEHAVVVIGTDDDTVYVNDPDFSYAPIGLGHDEFLAAWQERENRYAVLQLTEDK